MNIPSPAALASKTPRRTPTPSPGAARQAARERMRKRGCTDKVCYDTEALAQDAVVRGMLVYAEKPLRAYPCQFCTGWHLTSRDDGEIEAPPVIEGADPRDLVTQRDLLDRSKKAFRRHLERRHWSRYHRARREVEAEGRIDRLPSPRVATAAEADAFFAAHNTTTNSGTNSGTSTGGGAGMRDDLAPRRNQDQDTVARAA